MYDASSRMAVNPTGVVVTVDVNDLVVVVQEVDVFVDQDVLRLVWVDFSAGSKDISIVVDVCGLSGYAYKWR